MKKRIFAYFITSFCIAGIYAANNGDGTMAKDDDNVKAALKEAVIYYQGAQLNYASSKKLSKGENQITISGFSPFIDENSLKIALADFAVVSSYKFVKAPISNVEKNSETQIWRDSLNFCKKKVAELEDIVITNNNVLKMLKVNTGGNSDGDIDLLDLMTYADFYKSKSVELMAENRKANLSLEKYRMDILRFEQLIASTDYSPVSQQGILTIKIMSTADGESPLNISMFTHNASWTPYYDFNIKSTAAPVMIKFKAAIRQNTGVAWENVMIKLVASQLNRGESIPTINPRFVNYAQPSVPIRSIIPPTAPQDVLNLTPLATTDFVMDSDEFARTNNTNVRLMAGAKSKNVTMNKYVSQSNNDMGQMFDISLPYTIQGNDKNQFIDLPSKTATADFSYFTIPSIQQKAYLIAEIPDWDKIGLSSGMANITYDGIYMGETFINTQSTENKLSLTLGADNRIMVQREKLADFSSKKFFGNDVRQTFLYRTTIKNNQTNDVTITMKGQYPISNQKDIEVELMDKTTPPYSNDKTTGILTWKFTLKPGETKVIDNVYSVKYPKDSQINL